MHGLELSIRPCCEVIKALHSVQLFNCQLLLSDEDYENDGPNEEFTLEWFHGDREITETSGRLVYLFSAILTAAFFSLNTVKLLTQAGSQIEVESPVQAGVFTSLVLIEAGSPIQAGGSRAFVLIEAGDLY